VNTHKLTVPGQTTLDQPPGPNTWPPTSTLASTLNLAPSVTPNIANPTAPDAQNVCPGYKAFNVTSSQNNIVADLLLAGDACNAYGSDITELALEVQYQNVAQLNVKIYPKHLVQSNRSLYILDDSLSLSGSTSDGFEFNSSDLLFEWSNDPSFQFRIKRAASGEAIFDTYGHKLVFEDQFLEVVTSMVDDFNIYGLPEVIRGIFRLPNQYTRTFWNQHNEMND
jgi:alpha-glucosidase